MYNVILTHEVLPGKLPAMKEWFIQQDKVRKERDPNYTPPRRYITVFGSVHQFVAEFEMEKLPENPWVFAESAPEGAQAEFLTMIVPGRTELRVLKEIDLGS
jgi:hypothetical protein